MAEALVIAAGGAIGASVRYAVSLGIRAASLNALWATASANWLGAFLIGLIVARIDSPSAHPLLRPFLIIGVLGSFTTFSTLALDNRLLASQHGEAFASLHLLGSIGLGLLAYAAGARVAGFRR